MIRYDFNEYEKLNVEIRQMMTIVNTVARKIFLKLCYFFFMILCMSCDGETPKKKEDSKNTTQKATVEKEGKKNNKSIVFFGDSLTAGFGLENTKRCLSWINSKNNRFVKLVLYGCKFWCEWRNHLWWTRPN